MESIRIKDFGPIVDVNINDIKRFTLIIGPSGSGKSSVMKVLALARWIYKMLNIRAYLKQAGIKRSPFRFNIPSYLREDGIFDYLHEGTHIHYRNNGTEFSITGKTANFKIIRNVEPHDMCLEKISYITEKRNALADLLALSLKEKSAPFYLKELLDEYRVASKVVKSLQLDAVGVNLEVKKVNGIEYSFITGTTTDDRPYRIHLEDASSGIQSLAPLSMIVNYYAHHFNLVESLNKAILRYLVDSDNLKGFQAAQNIGDIRRKRVDIHIEEPELCLYPDNQLRLMTQLINECFKADRNYDISLMITTHSIYFLNQLNLLFKAHNVGTAIDGAELDFDETDVFAIENGRRVELKLGNAQLVNPELLSSPVDAIYNLYEQLAANDSQR